MFCVQLSTHKVSGYFESKWKMIKGVVLGGKGGSESDVQSGFEVQTKCHKKNKNVFEFPQENCKDVQINWFNLNDSS